MHSVALFTSLLLGLTPLISANCTNWTSTRWSADGPSGYSNYGFIPLETLECPTGPNKTCTIARKSYDITAERKLNISASAADIDNIFDLAQAGYGPRMNYTAPPFITRMTTVSSQDLSDIFVDVEPGMNKTLGWVPFLLYSSGILGECSNESLNGVGVMATAPYLMNNTQNISSVGGTFMASSQNSTEENAAGSLRGSGLSGALFGMMAVLFALLL